MSDRLGELEMLSRARELTPDESDELAAIIANEKRNTYRRNRWKEQGGAEARRQRYQNDPEYRRQRLETNERCRLRRVGRCSA